jgi:error-prone DNA polymerase
VIQKVLFSAKSFAAYGFPESHAIGFAMLAYGSTWLKFHVPPRFTPACSIINPWGSTRRPR